MVFLKGANKRKFSSVLDSIEQIGEVIFSFFGGTLELLTTDYVHVARVFLAY